MKFGLIGEKLGHTFSPEIHKKMNLEYAAYEIASSGDTLKNFVKNAVLDGFNVTIPYKQRIMEYLDDISPEAKEIGAVNTVAYKNGKAIGYNTDILGMEYALKKANICIKGSDVLILGSGGTANTAYYLAKKLAAKSVAKVSRNGDINYGNCYEKQETNVIINCTPVGMYPNNGEKPLDLSQFCALTGVFDVIYNPLRTTLCQQAKKLGIVNCDNGLRMLVAQAKFAHDIFANEDVEDDIIEKIYCEILAERENIALVGMPGCGKTTIGRRLAELLHKNFVDTDAEIAKSEGLTIPEIFAKYGEPYFRKAETAVTHAVACGFNTVIATGGGAVVNAKNAEAIMQNSYVIYIERELNSLDKTDRPKSLSLDNLRALYSERAPIYNAICDVAVPNNGSLDNIIEEIVNIYGKHFSH